SARGRSPGAHHRGARRGAISALRPELGRLVARGVPAGPPADLPGDVSHRAYRVRAMDADTQDWRRPEPDPADFHVEGWVDRLSGFIERHRSLWIRLGNLETRLVGGALAETAIDRPIYVCGLARSGTTILLETLAAHPDVT